METQQKPCSSRGAGLAARRDRRQHIPHIICCLFIHEVGECEVFFWCAGEYQGPYKIFQCFEVLALACTWCESRFRHTIGMRFVFAATFAWKLARTINSSGRDHDAVRCNICFHLRPSKESELSCLNVCLYVRIGNHVCFGFR